MKFYPIVKLETVFGVIPPFRLKLVISRKQISELLKKEIVDIHGVAEILGMSRSSVNVLLIRPSSKFPKPVYETSGTRRRPVRLWLRQEVISWRDRR